MAYEIPDQLIGLTAAADLSGAQFKVVYVSAADSVSIATDSANNAPIGILQNKPASGEAASVMVDGISKAVVGGAVAAGEVVSFDANGRVISTSSLTSPYYIVGIALEAASAADEVIPVLIRVMRA